MDLPVLNDSARIRYLHARLTRLVQATEDRLNSDEHADRQYLLEDLLDRLADICAEIRPTDPTDRTP